MEQQKVTINGKRVWIDRKQIVKKEDGTNYLFYNEDLTVDYESEKKQDLKLEKQKAELYLDSTDWVENYLLRRDAGLLEIPAGSNKLVIEQKRIEAKAILEK